MALGPFARIAAQFVMVTGAAVGRAFAKAYTEAAANNATASRLTRVIRTQMKPDEALKVMGLNPEDMKAVDFLQKVNQRKADLIALNLPREDFIGSPYLNQKVEVAAKILTQQAKPEADE